MKTMKKFVYLIVIVALWLTGCKTTGMEGELTGVQGRPQWFEPEPYGMAFVPQGQFTMGPNDQDVPWSMTAEPKTITLDAFWMDITEITNNEYRQFVFWVRDSIAMRLAVKAGIEDFKLEVDEEQIDPEFYDPNDPNTCYLDWSKRKDVWAKDNPELRDAIKDLFYDKQDAIFGKKTIDTRKLVYEYWYADLRQAAKRENMYQYDDLGGTGDLPTGHYEGKVISYDYDNYGVEKDYENRSDIVQHVKVPIYPDTLVWIRDFSYSYNEPWARKYFWHPAFDNYPVVGVNWHQARAFAAWRTKIMEVDNARKGIPPFENFRLPTEAEWEYAARGGLKLAMYPWGGPYIRNYQGCLLANFKPMRGMYALDGAARTMAVATYEPNGYGLYDMSGNVAEWCEDAYDDATYRFTHDLNPTYFRNAKKDDPIVLKRKVIRGGSWKDVGWYLQCGTRSYEYQDTAKSYIGFRCVRTYMGRDVSGYEGY